MTRWNTSAIHKGVLDSKLKTAVKMSGCSQKSGNEELEEWEPVVQNKKCELLSRVSALNSSTEPNTILRLKHFWVEDALPVSIKYKVCVENGVRMVPSYWMTGSEASLPSTRYWRYVAEPPQKNQQQTNKQRSPYYYEEHVQRTRQRENSG